VTSVFNVGATTNDVTFTFFKARRRRSFALERHLHARVFVCSRVASGSAIRRSTTVYDSFFPRDRRSTKRRNAELSGSAVFFFFAAAAAAAAVLALRFGCVRVGAAAGRGVTFSSLSFFFFEARSPLFFSTRAFATTRVFFFFFSASVFFSSAFSSRARRFSAAFAAFARSFSASFSSRTRCLSAFFAILARHLSASFSSRARCFAASFSSAACVF